MNEHNSSKRVILFSRDQSLIEAINLKQIGKENIGNREFHLEVESELSGDLIVQGSMAVAYDIDLVANDLSLAAVDILQLKNADLDRPLILIGTKEALKGALSNERIGAIVAKTVSKPNATSQLFMTISALSKKLHREEVVAQKTSKVGLYGAIGAAVCLVGLALFFILPGSDKPGASSELNIDVADSSRDISTPIIDDSQASNLAEIAKLKARALKASEAGQLISPKGDNALDYYQRILEIDDYDDEAYTGKWRIVKQLRASFPDLIEAGELDEASDVIAILIDAEPFNSSNNDLQAMLDRAGETNLLTGAEAQAPVVENKAVASEKTDESADQIKRQQQQERAEKALIEERLASRITTAIESGNLTPPQANNAYELLLSTVRQGNVRQSVLTPLKIRLENQLIERMQGALVDSDIDNAANDLKFIRNLNRNNSALPGLTASLIEAQRKAKPVATTEVATTEVASPKPAVSAPNKTTAEPANQSASAEIIPFEIVSKAKPDYPRRAYNLDIEGWVELEYQVDENGQPININVVSAEPKKIFDKAGLKAIKRSRFSPAKNSVTNETVVSEVSTIRFNFSLDR